LGRFGGEEFVLVMPESALDHALAAAERLREEIAGRDIPQLPVRVTVSVGLAQLNPDETAEQLLGRADRALYLAKNSGRNCCRIDP
jgi:diguanylate cyclase (GGDEF)-like protein